MNARLPARLLFSEDKFATFKIPPMLAQEKRDLKRKYNLTVEILVQTVEIAGAVLEQQR